MHACVKTYLTREQLNTNPYYPQLVVIDRVTRLTDMDIVSVHGPISSADGPWISNPIISKESKDSKLQWHFRICHKQILNFQKWKYKLWDWQWVRKLVHNMSAWICPACSTECEAYLTICSICEAPKPSQSNVSKNGSRGESLRIPSLGYSRIVKSRATCSGIWYLYALSHVWIWSASHYHRPWLPAPIQFGKCRDFLTFNA